MDKKLMIYPFNKQVGIVARYARLLQGYVLTMAVSPKNYGYEGEDAACICEGEPSGIEVTSSFGNGLAQCDSILFVASTFEMELDFYETKMREARIAGKEVLITKELAAEFKCDKRNVPENVGVLGSNLDEGTTSYDEKRYTSEISVPIITILQIGKHCDGLDTLLLLTERFENEGYRVGKVSSNTLGQLFGINSLPDYIDGHHMSYEDKIINLNHFLYSLVEEERPDLLLLEIEEAILPYTDKINNRFGVVPALVAQAVQADVGILNTYCSGYDKMYFDHLKLFCRYSLNMEIAYFGISNTTLIIQESDRVNPVHYISVERDAVRHIMDADYCNHEESVFFNISDLGSVDFMYHEIINKLSQNMEMVRI